MKKTSSPQTPTPTKKATKTVAKVDRSDNPRTEFLAAALSMSWQLAAVVLVPIIGGFEIDKKLNTLPLLTIVGFFMAMIGMALVVWRQLQLFAPPMPQQPAQHHKGSST